MSTATLTRPRPLVPPPTGSREHADALTCRRALLRLFMRRPNQIITHADVCAELGHDVGRGGLNNAAAALRRDMPIEGVSRAGGGYVLLVPMPTLGSERCANCSRRTPLSTCRRVRRAGQAHGTEVGLNCWCWGWEPC